jgi:hypothetical protein
MGLGLFRIADRYSLTQAPPTAAASPLSPVLTPPACRVATIAGARPAGLTGPHATPLHLDSLTGPRATPLHLDSLTGPHVTPLHLDHLAGPHAAPLHLDHPAGPHAAPLHLDPRCQSHLHLGRLHRRLLGRKLSMLGGVLSWQCVSHGLQTGSPNFHRP